MTPTSQTGVSAVADTPGPLGCLDALPRARLVHGPTPLEEMPNLSARLGGARLFVKRDDCTGLAFGGNKVRQLEFYLGEAQARDADTVLITGAIQSNFARLAAAAARKLGMEIHIQLEERVPKNDPVYRNSGNVLLDRLLGATIHSYAAGEDEAGADRQIGVIAESLRAEGKRPYIIPLSPGHAPLGALGYVVAAREIAGQLEAMDVRPSAFVVPSGSGATHAGFLFGLRALGIDTPVLGVCVRRAADLQQPRILTRCGDIAELLRVASPVTAADVQITDEFLAPGYGLLNAPTREAILMGASREALMLDPVYTGKSMAGFIRRARAEPDKSLLFLHTGGTPTMFAYANDLNEALDRANA